MWVQQEGLAGIPTLTLPIALSPWPWGMQHYCTTQTSLLKIFWTLKRYFTGQWESLYHFLLGSIIPFFTPWEVPLELIVPVLFQRKIRLRSLEKANEVSVSRNRKSTWYCWKNYLYFLELSHSSRYFAGDRIYLFYFKCLLILWLIFLSFFILNGKKVINF